MTVWTSVLWKIFMQLAKKWLEMVVKPKIKPVANFGHQALVWRLKKISWNYYFINDATPLHCEGSRINISKHSTYKWELSNHERLQLTSMVILMCTPMACRHKCRRTLTMTWFKCSTLSGVAIEIKVSKATE